MRVLELFSGYGSQALALENLGIEFTSDISEIDTYAIKAYNQIHGDTYNWGDITKIDETKLPYYDLITYSSPCQDFSVAGLGKGGDAGSGTRSSLLWECERIIRAVKPKYLLMENVKNLVGKAHVHNFNRWLRTLEMMGYWNFWQVLNAKDYGVPQNRERVFVVSILGGGQYLFPNKIKLEKRLKDILEPVVDEKYYLSNKMVQGFLKHNDNHLGKTGFVWQPRNIDGYASRLTSRMHKIAATDNTIAEPVIIGGMQANQSVKTDGVCTCLTSSMGTGGGYVPMVTEPLAYDEQNGYVRKDGCIGTLTTDGSSPKHNNRVIEPLHIKEATSKGYAEAYDGDSVTLDQPNSQTRRGRVGKQISNTLTTGCNIGVVQVGNIMDTDSFGGNPQCGRVYSVDGCSPTLNTMQGGGREPKIMCYDIPQIVKVRKHNVDINEFVRQLRGHKKKVGICNKQIAEYLNLPLTMVEHWFRTDKCFSVPDKDIWYSLKNLLTMNDEYDAFVTEFEEKEGVFEKANRCYGSDGIAPTITSASADEKIITLGNYMPSGHSASKIVDSNGITPTVMENHGTVTATVQNYRIRKLTPRECWRLMGVKDEQYDKLHDISNTQLYKMAGNSIVVDVLMGIFKNLFLSDEGTKGQLTLF